MNEKIKEMLETEVEKLNNSELDWLEYESYAEVCLNTEISKETQDKLLRKHDEVVDEYRHRNNI